MVWICFQKLEILICQSFDLVRELFIGLPELGGRPMFHNDFVRPSEYSDLADSINESKRPDAASASIC